LNSFCTRLWSSSRSAYASISFLLCAPVLRLLDLSLLVLVRAMCGPLSVELRCAVQRLQASSNPRSVSATRVRGAHEPLSLAAHAGRGRKCRKP
jgi:hypothetical protein